MAQKLEAPFREPALPFLAEDDVPLGFAEGNVAYRQDRRGVLRRLQQAGYDLRLVGPDGDGRFFHPDVGLEPVGQDVVEPVPPAGAVSLLGQVQQLLPLHRVDAVEGKEVEDVDLADRTPAELDAADLGVRSADRLGRSLRADSAAFPESPQLGTQQDAQHSGSFCRHRVRHRTSPAGTTAAELSRAIACGNALPTGFRQTSWYPRWEWMPHPKIGGLGGFRKTLVSRRGPRH